MSAAPYWNDLTHHQRHDGEGLFWLSDPVVRRRVNQRVTGDPECWPMDWLCQRLAPELPWGRALSIGCGTGALERDLLAKGAVRHVVGVDFAPQPLEFARQLARAAGFGLEQVEYVAADARAFLATQRGLDAVFFHGSLHHFDRLDELLGLVRAALRPGGWLVLDEYVGPSMHQWNLARLLLPNLAYYRLPRALRRVGRVRPPYNPEDPTEMVASAEIPAAVARHFEVEIQRDYGGNLVSLIYPNLRRPGSGPGAPTPELFRHGVERLLDWEEALLRAPGPLRRPSHHQFVVARVGV